MMTKQLFAQFLSFLIFSFLTEMFSPESYNAIRLSVVLKTPHHQHFCLILHSLLKRHKHNYVTTTIEYILQDVTTYFYYMLNGK